MPDSRSEEVRSNPWISHRTTVWGGGQPWGCLHCLCRDISILRKTMLPTSCLPMPGFFLSSCTIKRSLALKKHGKIASLVKDEIDSNGVLLLFRKNICCSKFAKSCFGANDANNAPLLLAGITRLSTSSNKFQSNPRKGEKLPKHG